MDLATGLLDQIRVRARAFAKLNRELPADELRDKLIRAVERGIVHEEQQPERRAPERTIPAADLERESPWNDPRANRDTLRAATAPAD